MGQFQTQHTIEKVLQHIHAFRQEEMGWVTEARQLIPPKVQQQLSPPKIPQLPIPKKD
jgi:hypothetical protein